MDWRKMAAKSIRISSYRRFFLITVYLFGLLGIVASGGGSGSDSTGISYTGNRDAALITSLNAARLVENIVVGQTILGSSSGSTVTSDISMDKFSPGIGLIQVPGRLTQKMRHTTQASPQYASRSVGVKARTDLDKTEACDNSGGFIHITGFLEDNGTGTLTLDYLNCREGNETLDGTVTVQINAFDFGLFLPTDAIYSFSVLTLTSSALNVSLDGSIHSQISTDTQTEVLTTDRLVARTNTTAEMLMISNQISIIEYDNVISPLSLSQTITGRVYDSTHGYVDIATFVPLVFSMIDQIFADSGELVLTGASNTSIRITVLASTVIMLELDLTGDGFLVGMFTVLRWDELVSPASSDLGDDDNDGMHNSWEQANGLNPSDVTDASTDLDGDGVSNIREYYAGTDPNSPGMVPDIDRPVIEATFFAPAVSYTAGSGPRAIAVDDFNLDGNRDVAVANWNDNGVPVLLGDGAGAFGSDASFASGPSPSAMALGDFNGDGNKDIAVANFGGPSVSVLFGTGSGTFGTPANFALTSPLNPTAVVAGDFNGDGNQDLAVTMSYGFSNVTPGHVSVLLGDGSGGFGAPANYTVGGTPWSVVIGDFNDDGTLDLAVANKLVSTVSILIGDGAGTFGVSNYFITLGNQATAVAAADVNGDVKPDLVATTDTGTASLATVSLNNLP